MNLVTKWDDVEDEEEEGYGDYYEDNGNMMFLLMTMVMFLLMTTCVFLSSPQTIPLINLQLSLFFFTKLLTPAIIKFLVMILILMMMITCVRSRPPRIPLINLCFCANEATQATSPGQLEIFILIIYKDKFDLLRH